MFEKEWKKYYHDFYLREHLVTIARQRPSKASLPLHVHVVRNTLAGILLIVGALFLGMVGYHLSERMSWTDSFLNASMILSGMGPASTLTTTSAKLFAGFYALFSGLAFIAIVVIVFSPVIHVFFRKIHIESIESNRQASENEE